MLGSLSAVAQAEVELFGAAKGEVVDKLRDLRTRGEARVYMESVMTQVHSLRG